jgi:hypothetical protein
MTSTNVLSAIPHIDTVAAFSDNDKPLFNELREVLQKYQALNRFGITLLHNHFSLGDDEVLLEKTDVSARKQTIEPISLKRLNEMNVIETAWCMDDKNIHVIGRCQIENTSVPPQHVDRP